jgi:hypothetical protein
MVPWSKERASPRSAGLLIVTTRIIPRAATQPFRASWTFVFLAQPVDYSRTASDQHQPASSRATATLAMTGFFFRSVNFIHCRFSL